MTRHFVVIGCGTAGAATTLMARKTSRDATITILQDESLPEYSRCGLPYTVNRVIPNMNDVIIHPESFYTGKLVRADLRLNTEATKVDLKTNTVTIQANGGSTDSLTYDALVFATGARPSTPPIEGLDASHVYRLHTFEDAKRLQAVAKKGKTAAIIGAGLVGLETAEALHTLGLKITVIEFLSQVLPAMIDNEMGTIVQEKMEADGLSVKLGTAAKKVTKTHVLVADRENNTEENQG